MGYLKYDAIDTNNGLNDYMRYKQLRCNRMQFYISTMTIVFLIEWDCCYRERLYGMNVYDDIRWRLVCDTNNNNVNEQGYLYYNIK